MAKIEPFRGVRPRPEHAEAVASPPYDVMSAAEAKDMAADNPHSFLRVIRAEIEFPESADPYSDEVYEKGGANLQKLQDDGIMQRDQAPCFYCYRQKMGDHIQTGIVATASCQEYDTNEIRKHEYTRPAKEEDRTRHIQKLGAQTGPVWLAYRAVDAIDQFVNARTSGEPVVHFTAPDGIEHSYWVVDQAEDVNALQALFAEHVPTLYIADGHHRSAAASRTAKARREAGASADAPSQFFLSVIYPDNQLQILPYNRFVHDLNGHSPEGLLAALTEQFDVVPLNAGIKLPSPPDVQQFDMYLDGKWYRLDAKPGTFDEHDPIESLDVHILQSNVLNKLLNIDDPRTNKRIEFIGGIRGHKELVRRVDAEGGVAFACYATSMAQLFSVADANQVMPPKSTWFEPKLRSGLFVHLLD
jgi:uncharacterized protein (DUF1015 family)